VDVSQCLADPAQQFGADLRPLHSYLDSTFLKHPSQLSSLCDVQAWDAPGTGLIINERLVNCPPQLAPPLVQALFDEVGWAVEDEPQVPAAVWHSSYGILAAVSSATSCCCCCSCRLGSFLLNNWVPHCNQGAVLQPAVKHSQCACTSHCWDDWDTYAHTLSKAS
jgi:hypothetical protein